MRIVFLTRDMNLGGAPRQLATLALALAERGHAVTVATLYGDGPMLAALAGSHVRHVSLAKRGRFDMLTFLPRLVAMVRRERPEVLHGYRHLANVLAVVLAPFLPGTRIVIGLRNATLDFSPYDRVDRALAALEARASRRADLVITNSQAGRSAAIARGFPAERIAVVPNGIDLQRFRADAAARRRLRAEWGVPEHVALVGHVARFDPIKGHATFLRAAAQLAADDFPAAFVCVGGGAADDAAALAELARGLGLGDRLIWAGARADMEAVYSSLDLLCVASLRESFPNVVAEAMACGVRCIVTETAGDAAAIVGDAGSIVAPGDPAALAGAVRSLLGAGPADGAALRLRIETRFSIERLAENTLAALAALD